MMMASEEGPAISGMAMGTMKGSSCPDAWAADVSMEAGLVTTESKVVIPVVECRIPYKMFLDTVRFRQEVINLVDDQENNFSNYGGIKFGSMEKGNNEAGNWGDE